jgi:WD40 repeat protein
MVPGGLFPHPVPRELEGPVRIRILKIVGSLKYLIVDWTPDGSILVTGGHNSPLLFWNSTDLSIAGEFESPERILSARFSPDGTKLIFAGQNRSTEDGYVETWAVP